MLYKVLFIAVLCCLCLFVGCAEDNSIEPLPVYNMSIFSYYELRESTITKIEMLGYEWNEIQQGNDQVDQYRELQRLNDATITDIAMIISKEEGDPIWKWFSIIRDASEMGLIGTLPT